MTVKRPMDNTNTGDIIRDHAFLPSDPERQYWSLCGHIKPDGKECRLALAAHAESVVDNVPVAPRAKPETPAEVRTEELPELADQPIQTVAMPEFNGKHTP